MKRKGKGMNAYPQKATGKMTYPGRGTWNRYLFKTPQVFWRMGLGSLLGNAVMVLTTRGRKTGPPRHTMVSYTLKNGKYYLISGWGRNIQSDPRVTVQTGQQTFSANARRVENGAEFRTVVEHMLQVGGDSHFEPWLESLGIERSLDDLMAKRDRVYLIALDQTVQPGPSPMEIDLLWLWPVLIITLLVGWVLGRLSK